MKHLIIEGFCDGNKGQDAYPCNNTMELGIHCFECSKFSYTHCPNEIAISNENGVVEEFIGFGGSMEPLESEKREEYVEFWKKICKEKIDEAYTLFLRKIN